MPTLHRHIGTLFCAYHHKWIFCPGCHGHYLIPIFINNFRLKLACACLLTTKLASGHNSLLYDVYVLCMCNSKPFCSCVELLDHFCQCFTQILDFSTVHYCKFCFLTTHTIFIAFIAAFVTSSQATFCYIFTSNFGQTHHHLFCLHHFISSHEAPKWQGRNKRRNVTFQPIHVMTWRSLQHQMISRHLGIVRCWTLNSLTISFSILHHHQLKRLVFKFILEALAHDHTGRVATLW